MKEITENMNKWKAILCPWVFKLNVVKNAHATQSDLHIESNPYQFSNDMFTIKNDFKIYMKPQKTSNSKAKSITFPVSKHITKQQ